MVVAAEEYPAERRGTVIGVVSAAAGLAQAPLALVGSQVLCQRYALALQRFHAAPPLLLDNTAPAGLYHLARAAGMIKD